jgi:hypothetical protein
LSALARLAKEQVKVPVTVLEIEGIDTLFGTDLVTVPWYFDDIYSLDTPTLRWDTPIADPRNLAAISPDGTTKNLTQQVLPDKGGTSSVAALRVSLVDVNQQVTKLLNFKNIEDLLGKKATVYFLFQGASHPNDSLPIIRGYVDDYEVTHGVVNVSVSHPENLKRKELYSEYIANLTDEVNDSVTVMPATLTSSLYLSQDVVESFIRIDDEVMKVISKTDSSITVQRAQFGTIAEEHEEGADITAIYRLTGQPIDLALKLMMSGEGDLFYGRIDATSIGFITVDLQIPNAIFFGQENISETAGLVAGDIVEIDSGVNAGQYLITGFGQNIFGYWIEVDQNLVTEVEPTTAVRFKSKYAVLPFGLKLTGNEVDVAGHEDIVRFNPENFPDYEFFMSKPPNGKEFIDKQIYYPVALYSVPRRARISCKLVQPPLATSEVVIIDERTLVNIEKVKVKRSVHKYLYNTLFYRYDLDPVDDKYLAGALFRNEFSLARIKVGTKAMQIESEGLRNNAQTTNLLQRQQQRIFDRYRFAAQEIVGVEVPTGVGYSVEVGDIVIFGSDNLQLADLSQGKRQFKSRLCEVINKNFDIFTGRIQLTLLESAYDLNARYGIISPSSLVGAGGSSTEVPIVTSFDVGEFDRETDKWLPFFGERIRVRSADYSFDETTRILGTKPGDSNRLLVTELPSAPLEGYILEVPDYEVGQDAIYKDLFVYKNPSTTITSVISPTVLELSDTSALFEGAEVYILGDGADPLNDTFRDEGLIIDSIDETQVTLNRPVDGISPGATIELIGFVDGAPYRII